MSRADAIVAVSTVLGSNAVNGNWGSPRAGLHCVLPQPGVLLSERGAIFQKWELLERPLRFTDALPRDAGYLAYRNGVYTGVVNAATLVTFSGR